MKKQKIMRLVSMRLVSSFAFVPLMALPAQTPKAMDMPMDTAPTVITTQIAVSQKINKGIQALSLNQAVSQEDQDKEAELSAEALAIDNFFAANDMPLEGVGRKMADEADKNDIDWRLLPAIAVRESTGGKHACKKASHNPFGWASCKVGFKSDEEAIEIVAKNLGGNNEKTAHHYDNKTTLEILHAYNPPSIVPKYAEQVIGIMNRIGDENTASSSIALL